MINPALYSNAADFPLDAHFDRRRLNEGGGFIHVFRDKPLPAHS
jgi:hypothetical protein